MLLSLQNDSNAKKQTISTLTVWLHQCGNISFAFPHFQATISNNETLTHLSLTKNRKPFLKTPEKKRKYHQFVHFISRVKCWLMTHKFYLKREYYFPMISPFVLYPQDAIRTICFALRKDTYHYAHIQCGNVSLMSGRKEY